MDSHQKIKIFLKKMLPLLLSSAKAIEADKEIENEEFIKSYIKRHAVLIRDTIEKNPIEIKEEIKTQSTLLSNLKKENELLNNQLANVKSTQRESSPSVQTKQINKEIRNILDDMYYQKEMLEATKRKIIIQQREIDSLYNLNPNLREKEFNEFTGDQVEKENDNTDEEVQREKEKIQNIKKTSINVINKQNEEMQKIQSEIEQIEATIKQCEQNNNMFAKRTLTNFNKKHYTFQMNNSNSTKDKDRRPKSIESKNKRKPFNNFNFI